LWIRIFAREFNSTPSGYQKGMGKGRAEGTRLDKPNGWIERRPTFSKKGIPPGVSEPDLVVLRADPVSPCSQEKYGLFSPYYKDNKTP
jgi:hypothetical protein